MTYQDFIQNILDTRGRFNCGEEYHETHHILPKCLGGNNDEDNLIDLFAKEHFIAHKMLAEENPNNNSLVFAWTCMAFPSNKSQERYELLPEEYEKARKAMSNVMSGRRLSEETKKKLSDSRKGKSLSIETKNKLSESLKGITFTTDHKENISKSLIGRTFSDKHRANISKSKTGKSLSEAQKTALKIVCEMNRGRKHSEESKAKISAGNKGKRKRGIGIAQYDLSGNLIREWMSVTEASIETGIDGSCITKCAKGKRKTAGGFIWKYI